MSKGALRAVGDDERPAGPKAEIKSVLDAAEHGTRMDELVQMRLVIARAIDDPATSARDLAALIAGGPALGAQKAPPPIRDVPSATTRPVPPRMERRACTGMDADVTLVD